MYEEAGGGTGSGESRGPTRGSGGLDERGARILTHVVYGLQAALVLNGVTLLLGAILNYVKRSDVRGTLYESHFQHQIRTFWVAAGGVVAFLLVGGLLVAPAAWGAGEPALEIGMVGVVLLGLVAVGLVVYVYYRIVRGWLALLEERPLE